MPCVSQVWGCIEKVWGYLSWGGEVVNCCAHQSHYKQAMQLQPVELLCLSSLGICLSCTQVPQPAGFKHA